MENYLKSIEKSFGKVFSNKHFSLESSDETSCVFTNGSSQIDFSYDPSSGLIQIFVGRAGQPDTLRDYWQVLFEQGVVDSEHYRLLRKLQQEGRYTELIRAGFENNVLPEEQIANAAELIQEHYESLF